MFISSNVFVFEGGSYLEVDGSSNHQVGRTTSTAEVRVWGLVPLGHYRVRGGAGRGVHQCRHWGDPTRLMTGEVLVSYGTRLEGPRGLDRQGGASGLRMRVTWGWCRLHRRLTLRYHAGLAPRDRPSLPLVAAECVASVRSVQRPQRRSLGCVTTPLPWPLTLITTNATDVNRYCSELLLRRLIVRGDVNCRQAGCS